MTAAASDAAAASPESARKALYEIIRGDASFEQKALDALELGRAYLGVDNGHLTRIDQETDHWEAIASTDSSDGRFPPGLELDLGTTYCRRTIESDSQITLHDAPNQGWADDPAFEAHGLSCYHGTSIILDGEPYGTVCFVGEGSREPFTDGETMFVELLARLLERELERDQHEAQLTRQANLSTVLNRVLRHNLKNDMSVIRGYTQLMSDKLGSPQYGKTSLDNIDKLLNLSEKARKLDRIVNADFERRSVDITRLLTEMAQTLTTEYPDASITVEYDDDITAAVLPSFERALRELIENAAKHGGDPATVRITVSSVPNAVEIRIVDDGSGLEEEEAEVLKTGSETPLVHGSGLGLWLAHWIVSSHGGSIDATGTDEGTTMTISVPREGPTSTGDELTKLTQARDQYQAAFDKANDAMVIINDDAQIIDANPRASQIYGMDEQALLGQPLTRFFPDDFDFDAFWRRSNEEGTELETMTLVGADGAERTVEYSAANRIVPGQTLIVSRDITARIEREQTLRETTQQLNAVFEASPDPIIALDTDGRIRLWNAAAESLFGYSEAEAVGEPIHDLDLFPAGEISEFRRYLKRALDGETFENLQVERRGRDGDRIDLSVSTAPLRDQMGEVSGVMAVLNVITERKQRERETREAKQRLDLALEGSDTGVWDWDLDTDEIHWDETMERLFGLEPDTFEGTLDAFIERIHPDDRSDVAAAIQACIESEDRYEATFRIQREDGEQRWVNARGEVCFTDGCERMIGILADVTEKKTHERKLEEFQSAVAASGHAIFMTDTDGTIEYVNEAFEEITGYTATEAIGQTPRMLDSGEMPESYFESLWETIRDGDVYQENIVNRRKDGSLYHANQTIAPITDESGDVRAFVAVHNDVTEAKEREREFESLQDQYKALLDAAPDPVFVADAETGEILEMNETAEALIGESKEALVGRHHSTLHPTEHAELYREAFKTVQGERTTVQTLPDGSQPELATADGGTIPVEISVNTVSLSDGPVMFGIFRDMKLEQKNERLEKVATMVSHDLRNPLTVAQGRLELLQDEYQSEEIAHIEKAHTRIETLIEDILTLARSGDTVGETESVVLSDLVDSCWQTIETADATLVVATERTVQADESRLKQLVENVFRNSVDHGGDDVAITVGDLDDGFYIADDGPGIPAAERDRVFESGYSTTPDGTGFGLAIVREISGAHGWEIGLTESDGGGARFEITGVEPDE